MSDAEQTWRLFCPKKYSSMLSWCNFERLLCSYGTGFGLHIWQLPWSAHRSFGESYFSGFWIMSAYSMTYTWHAYQYSQVRLSCPDLPNISSMSGGLLKQYRFRPNSRYHLLGYTQPLPLITLTIIWKSNYSIPKDHRRHSTRHCMFGIHWLRLWPKDWEVMQLPGVQRVLGGRGGAARVVPSVVEKITKWML